MIPTITRPHCGWVVAVLLVTAFHAGPVLAQQESSHLVVPASRINQLAARSDAAGNCPRFGDSTLPFYMVRQKSNGEQNTSPFIVPPGKNFVITDVVWTARTRRPESGFIDNGSLEISIEVYSESTPGNRQIATRLPFVIIPADIGSKPFGGSHQFKSGIRIPAGHGICVRADAWQLRATSSLRSSENIHQAYVQGYLIKTP